jgi:uncharacterized protein (DUF697 family)
MAMTDVMSEEFRDKLAAQTVGKYAAWTAAAGVLPLPLLDTVAVGGLQLQMLRRLAEIYSTPFNENLGKSILASLVGAILPASVASTASFGVLSLLKGFPVVGGTLAAVTLPALSAGSTYAIGRVFIQHFASGGTLLDFNPHDYRAFMKAQAEKRASAQPVVAPSP